MRIAAWVWLALLLALLPATALAADPRSGSQVTIGPGQTVTDDLYLMGGTIDVQGTVQGDVVAAGGTVNITGNVTGDVIAAGGTVNVSGQVGRSVRATGGSVNVDGPVSGDVVVGGGSLTLGPNARVTRDLLVGAGSATIDGQVGRNVSSGSGNLTVNGTVGGNVLSRGGNLRLGDAAVITGGLNYASSQEASIPSGAQVRGGVQRQALPQSDSNPVASAIADWIRSVVGLIAAGLLFLLIFSRVSRRSIDTVFSSPWASLGIGLGLLIVTPIVAVIVMIAGAFIGGWWIGLVVLAAYGIAIALSIPIAGTSLGSWILERVSRSSASLVWPLLLGVVVLMLVSLVPVLGGIVLFVAVLFGLGALAIAATRGPRTPAVAELRRETPPGSEVAA